MGVFKANTSIEYYFYSLYLDSQFNETTGIRDTIILDSKPIISFTLRHIVNGHYFYTRAGNITLTFEFSTLRGKINNATLFMNNTKLGSVLKQSNFNYTFSGSGLYNFTLFVNTSLNVNSTEWLVIVVDQNKPLVSITSPTNNTVVNNGYLELFFTYSDNSTGSDTGILQVLIDWGDGVQTDATNLTRLDHTYYKSGEYTIVITVFDKVGNNNTVSLLVTVNVPVISESTNQGAPLPTTVIVFALFVAAILTLRRKNKVR